MSRCPGFLVLLLSLFPVFLLAQPATTQTNIALATNGVDFLASFVEEKTPSIATIRFDGKSLGATQKFAPDGEVSLQPLAYAGNVYLHVSRQGLDIVFRRITANGVIVDQTPVAIDTLATGLPAVASDGKNFLVVWPGPSKLLAAFIAPDGTVGTIRTLVQREGWSFSNPRLAFDGTRFAMTYASAIVPIGFPAPSSGGTIEAVTVTDAGVAGQPITLFDSPQPDAPIASGGHDFLVAGQTSDGKDAVDLVAWRLVPNGTSLTIARRTTLLHGLDAAPSVAWNGGAYVVAWRAFGPHNFGRDHPQSFLGLTHLRADGTFDPISSIPTGEARRIPAVGAGIGGGRLRSGDDGHRSAG